MAPQIVTLAADVPQELGRSPFQDEQPCVLFATGTPDVYGVFSPGTGDTAKYQRFAGDGTKTTWNDTTDGITVLTNAHDDGGVAVATADNLRIVVKVGGKVLTRVSSGAAASAGEFEVDASGSPVVLTLGEAPADGELVEVWILDAADIAQFTGGTLVANVRYEVGAREVVVASAAAYFERLLR